MNASAARSEPAVSLSPTSWSLAPWIVVAVAVLVRWIYYSQVRGFILFDEATGDAAQYLSLAEAVRTQGLSAPHGQAYFQAPLYPLYLALVQSLGGSLAAARLLQFAAGVAGALLAWDTGRRLRGPAAGLAAGLLAGVYGPRLFFEGELLSIAWALVLFQLATWSLVVWTDTGRSGWAGLAGLASSLAALAQPNTALIIPVAAVWIFFQSRPGDPTRRTRGRSALIFFLVATLVPIVPVLLRNKTESGDWILISANGGINFFIGNNPDADGTFHLPAGEPLLNSTDGLAASATAAASSALGHPAGPSETSSYWFGRGLRFWTSQPIGALGLTARKILYFLNATELPNHYDIAFFRESVPVLRILPGWLLLGPLAVWGLLRLAQKQGILLLLALSYAASVVFFFITDRYRLPVTAVLFPAAGVAVAEIIPLFQRRKPGEMIPVAATLGLFLLLAGFQLVDTRPGLAHMHNLVGTLHYRRANLGAASREFEAALSLDPKSAEAMNNLGRISLLGSRHSEAETWFRQAVAADARLPEAYFNLEEVERNRGEWEEALRTLSELERSVPGAATAWAPAIAYRRGLLYQARGDTPRARSELETAVRLKPDLAGAWGALGVLDLTAGELTTARDRLSRAAQLAPEAYTNHLNLGLVAERQRDYPAALASYQEAQRLAPEKAQVFYRTGIVLEALGRPREAVEAYREAGRIGGGEMEMNDIRARIATLEGRLP